MLPERVFDWLLWCRMQVFRWTHWRRIIQVSKDPRRTQERLLREIIRENRSTDFARQYGFDSIRSYREYANAVPVQTYESLRPFVEEHEVSGTPTLTATAPVMYAQTSGTTGKPKLIPILPETLKMHRWNQGVQSYLHFRSNPAAYRGHLLGIVSPSVEGTLASGVPYGSASGLVYKNMPALARSRYVVPPEVFAIDDYELQYLVILRLALVQRDISFIGVANPSTLLKLVSLLRTYRKELFSGLADGTFWRWAELPPQLQHSIASRLACTRDRHDEIKRVFRQRDPDFADLWPEIRLVVTWTRGSCGIALAAVKQMLPDTARVSELGYLSSEFRGTLTIEPERNVSLPTIHENFFEFVERDTWDSGVRKFKLIDELRAGSHYYVFVTTKAGLYRYFMNDIVTVTGRFNQTPTIQFLQKGKGVTNITGEKLYESQVLQAVREVQETAGHISTFVLMLANPRRAGYRLILESPDSNDISAAVLARQIDDLLGTLNMEYRAKRSSQRLGQLEVVLVRGGTWDAYKRHCIRNGQREGQFKIVALQYDEDCSFDFTDFRVDSCQGVRVS